MKAPHREDVLELGGVGGEQRNVEHALGYRLLGRVPVGVQLGLQQRGWLGGITSGGKTGLPWSRLNSTPARLS